MAQIVDGGLLDGAKLIGQIQINEEDINLAFNTMTLDGQIYNIQAVAMDLNNDSTALADNVDRHIVSRYGSLALASFLTGYMEAIQGTSTTTDSNGNTTTDSPAVPDPADQLKVAVGRVGETFIPVLEENFNRANTITLESGKAMGIMFMSGVKL